MRDRPANLKAHRRAILVRGSRMLAALGVLLFGTAAQAAGGWQDQGQAAVRLIGGGPAGTPLLVGIEFRLAPGWATYWRDAGEAGIPPRFDWSGSENIAEARVLWPFPERLSEGGFRSFGYQGHVVLPVELKPVRPDTPIQLRLTLDYAVCGRVCIPKRAELTPVPGAGAGENSAIARFLARVPRASVPGLKLRDVRLGRSRLVVGLAADPPLPPGARLDVIAEGPNGALTSVPVVDRASAGREIAMTLTPGPGEHLPAMLQLTVIAGDKAVSAVARRGAGR